VPQDPFLVDRFALAYRYMPGRTLAAIGPGGLPGTFFEALERLAENIHARGIAHLDLRYRQNVLVLDDGTPAVLDFQACVHLDRLPRFLRTLAEQVDFSGVYKHWLLRSSEPMDERRLAAYRRLARRRRLWVVHGYLLRPERTRRRGGPPEPRPAGRA
jgi:RIO-like serine/threonine protein kinase